jgi:RHS repeat-associated protein
MIGTVPQISAGKRVTMSVGSGTTTYNYDTLDRLTTKAAPAGVLSYSYDGAGNLASMSSNHANGILVAYAWDELNRLSTVTDSRLLGNQTTTYTYDPASNVATVTAPNGLQTKLNYDSLNRLTSLTTPISSYTYTLGQTGNRIGAVEGNGRTLSWNYDGIYRLTNETITADPSQNNGSAAYSLDPVGNRLSLNSSLPGINSGSFGYNADDQISSESYDLDGNVLAAGGNTFVYDAENHMTSANNGAVRMIYDGDGNRVAKIVNGVTTQYLVDDLNPTGLPQVVEEVVNGAVTRQYTYGLQRISENQSINGAWTTSFYVYDGAGSVRQLANYNGAVTDEYGYDAFGYSFTKQGTTPNNYLYRGEQFDSDLGLYYLRARYYSPSTGRFMSRDPEGGIITDPATLHKYFYASGDPVNRIDPSGRMDGATAGPMPSTAGIEYALVTLVISIRNIAAVAAVEVAVVCGLTWDATNTIADVKYGIDKGRGLDAWIERTGPCSVKEKARCKPDEDNHHLLPQQFRDWFVKCGFPDIDSPEYMKCVPQNCHTGSGGLHPEWNQRWRIYIYGRNLGKCPAGGTIAILDFLADLMNQFQKQLECIGDDE